MAVDQQASAESTGRLPDEARQGRVVRLPQPPHPVRRLVEGQAAAVDSLAARDHAGDGAEPRTHARGGAVHEVRQWPVEHAGIKLPGLAVGVAVDAREGRGQQGDAVGGGAREKLLHEAILRTAERHRVEPAVGQKRGGVVAP